MGPREVAGTVHSENPWELGVGKGTNRQISLRGFEECKWLPKNVKLSASVANNNKLVFALLLLLLVVATRRLERAPIFC